MKKLAPSAVYNRVGWFFCVLEVIVQFVATLILIGCMIVDRTALDHTDILMVASAVSYYAIGFPLFILCMSTLDGKAKEQKSKLTVKQFAVFFFISFAVMNVTNLLNLVFQQGFQMITGHELGSALDDMIIAPTFITILTSGILAPIVEEYTFRYFALNKLRKYGEKIAIVITSVLFGVFHGNFEQFIYATAIGLVFGYVVCKTGQIWYSIVLHMLLNLCGGIIPLVVEQINNPVVTLIFTVVSYAAILVGIILFARNIHNVHLEAGTEYVEHPIQTAICNPGMLVFLIGSIVLMVFSLVSQIATVFLDGMAHNVY